MCKSTRFVQPNFHQPYRLVLSPGDALLASELTIGDDPLGNTIVLCDHGQIICIISKQSPAVPHKLASSFKAGYGNSTAAREKAAASFYIRNRQS